ncbi:MAG TPA: hypothetical protein ENJ43_03180 [Gammaproteobacteria bacterium]|nr:hypothetical protein [Gammaproteobacteria bacterium]
MLGEVRDYLKRRGSATKGEISSYLGSSEQATELALKYWINKGRIRIITPPCGSCDGCPGARELYEWLEPAG